MAARVAIGDFSRMTHLSVTALRHYHEIHPGELDSFEDAHSRMMARVRTNGLPQRSECRPHLAGGQLRLFPRCEVAASSCPRR
jgi:hypothetical protein